MASTSVAAVAPVRAKKIIQHKPGLRWCFERGQISIAMYDAGERYGRDYRDAEMGDACTIQSSLAALETGACGNNGGRPIAPAGGIDAYMQERILTARVERDAVHAALFFEPDACATLAAICGKQMTPTEAAREHFQGTEAMVRERAKLVTQCLKMALRMVAAHYRKRADEVARLQAASELTGRPAP